MDTTDAGRGSESVNDPSTDAHSHDPGSAAAPAIHAVAVYLLFQILYVLTLSPGPQWGDSIKLVRLSRDFYLYPNIGYHPLRTVLAAPFNALPFGDLAYRQNMASAFFGALTIMLFFLFMRSLTRSTLAAWLGALCLGFSHLFWHLSVITESYAWLCMFLVLTLWAWWHYADSGHTRYLCMSTAAAGLGMGAHFGIVFTIIPLLLALLVILFWRRFTPASHLESGPPPWRRLVLATLWFFIGASFFIGVSAVWGIKEGWTVRETVFVTLDLDNSHFIRYELTPMVILKDTLKRGVLLAYQFPVAIFLFGIAGVVHAFRRSPCFAWSLGGVLFCNYVFSMTVLVPKWPYFTMGTTVATAVFIGMGAGALQARLAARRGILAIVIISITIVPILVYSGAAALVNAKQIHISRAIPYRDNARFFLLPWKNNERSATRFVESIQMLPAGAVIISDFSAAIVLTFAQETGQLTTPITLIDVAMPDFDIIKYMEKHLDAQDIYVVGGAPVYQMDLLRSRYLITPTSGMWRVSRRTDEPGSGTNLQQ